MAATKEQIKEFNKEYNLNSINLDWFVPEDHDASEVEIPGKPTKIFADIMRRFAKNKVSLVAFIVFVVFILFIIIGYFTRPYFGSETIISASEGRSDFYNWMPSNLFNDSIKTFVVSRVDVATYEALNQTFPGVFNVIINDPSNPESVTATLNITQLYPQIPNNVIIGTQANGYDIWSRVLEGALFSIGLAFSVAIVQTVISVAIGSYIGFHAGRPTDTILMRIIEAYDSINPILILTIAFIIFEPTFLTMFIVFIILLWPSPVYITRSYILIVKDREFIKASKLSGASKFRLIFYHALPSIIGRLALGFVTWIPRIVFIEVIVVFILGLGTFTDTVTLGSLFAEARQFTIEQPQYVWFIVSILVTMSLSMNLMATGLRDALDPKIVGS